MPDRSNMRPETLLQHLGEETHILGAVVPPIFQNSLFVFDTWDEFKHSFEMMEHERHNYSRISNPTLDFVEKKIAMLENTDRAKVFGSGMAAISAAIMSAVHKDAHVVCVDTVYGPTRQFLSEYLPKFGVTVTFVDGCDPQEWVDATRPETTLYYLESPSSLLFRLQDLNAVCKEAKARNITTICDNSYATPLFQRPADFGVDLVVHSATKYFGGHSDIVAGIVAGNKERMLTLKYTEVALFGGALAPFPAWLMLRSLRTMPLRMKAHQTTANFVAKWLAARPEIAEVNHVGADDFAQRELRDKQMNGTGGLFSFVPKFQTEEAIKTFCNSLEIFQMGVSWGGHESLVVGTNPHPKHWDEPKWVIRLFCGLEHEEDLINDLDQALQKVRDAGLAQ